MCVQRFFKKAAAFVLRSVAKHSPELAQAVVASGGMEALVHCLEEFDPSVKETAALALQCIAQHNTCKKDVSPFPNLSVQRWILRHGKVLQTLLLVLGCSTVDKTHFSPLHHNVTIVFFHVSPLFLSPGSVVAVGRGCRRRPPAGVVSLGA